MPRQCACMVNVIIPFSFAFLMGEWEEKDGTLVQSQSKTNKEHLKDNSRIGFLNIDKRWIITRFIFIGKRF